MANPLNELIVECLKRIPSNENEEYLTGYMAGLIQSLANIMAGIAGVNENVIIPVMIMFSSIYEDLISQYETQFPREAGQMRNAGRAIKEQLTQAIARGGA